MLLAAATLFTARATILLNVTLPEVLVSVKLATWFGPVRLVSPPDVVVSALARMKPFAPSLIVLPAVSVTSPSVRIDVFFGPPFSWMLLPAVSLMVPPARGGGARTRYALPPP